jgi:hypothetical protein
LGNLKKQNSGRVHATFPGIPFHSIVATCWLSRRRPERCTAREKKSRNEGQSQEFQRCVKANCFIGKFLIGANNQITIIIAQEAFNVKLDYPPVQTKSPNTCLLS